MSTDPKPAAEVTTYGGGTTVQHWQLIVDGVFLADTSAPHLAEWFADIARRLNAASEET